MKTKFWVFLLVGILAVCLGLSVLLLMPAEPAAFVQVYADGKLQQTLDLRKDAVVTVQTLYGINVVTVKNGMVAVTEASCPDKHCMNRGFCNSGAQIVCLPNRVVLRFTNTGGIDGVVG